MKKLLLLLATVAAIAGTGFAQAPAARKLPAQAGALQSPEQMARRGTQYLTKELGLSADQQARLQPVLLAQNQELMAVRTKMQASARPSPSLDTQNIIAKYDARLKGIFTPGQYAKYTQWQTAERARILKSLQRQGVTLPATR
jgi:hypothetical protein